jgi:hypothetical protein
LFASLLLALLELALALLVLLLVLTVPELAGTLVRSRILLGFHLLSLRWSDPHRPRHDHHRHYCYPHERQPSHKPPP